MHLYSDANVLLTSVETGYVDGWTVAGESGPKTNNESGFKIKGGSTEYAQVYPWRGFFAIFGLIPANGLGVAYDVSGSNRHARLMPSSTTLELSVSSNLSTLSWNSPAAMAATVESAHLQWERGQGVG